VATLANIRDWVRQQTLVEAADFSAANLTTVINQGLYELGTAGDWPFLDASAALIIEDGADAYALPTGFDRLVAVYDDDGVMLPETHRRSAVQQFRAPVPGKPQAFYLWQEQLVFVPAPDTTFFMTVDYRKLPTLLVNDTDVPEWHPAFHMVLAEYAASKVWEREEDMERAGFYYGNFLGKVNDMELFYRNRGMDSPLVVGFAQKFNDRPWSWQRN